jgi:hypothetical protein
MKRWHALLLLWLLVTPAFAGDVLVRSEISPKTAWVGQRVLLKIDVLAPEAWAKVASFGVIEIAGAYVLPRQDQGVRLQQTIDGVSYSGQQYELSLFPQRAGELRLAARSLEVELRQLGGDAEVRNQQVQLPAVSFIAKLPPGAEGIDGLISSTRFEASQSWQPQATELKIGDAIQRTIRLQADDLSGMAFAPLPPQVIDGLGIYPAEARVDDKFYRGDLSGSRIESITYVAQRAGSFEIPAIRLSWWDLGKEQLRRIELKGISLSVSGTLPGQGAQASSGMDWRWLVLPFLLLAGLIGLRHPLIGTWRRWRQQRAASEASYFRALQRSIRQAEPRAIHAALMRWLDRINEADRPMRLDTFLATYGNGEDAGSLHAGLLDASSNLDRRGLLASLNQARARWLQASQRQRLGSGLPPLN